MTAVHDHERHAANEPFTEAVFDSPETAEALGLRLGGYIVATREEIAEALKSDVDIFDDRSVVFMAKVESGAANDSNRTITDKLMLVAEARDYYLFGCPAEERDNALR